MRTTVAAAAAALCLIAAFAPLGPAAATSTSQAIGLCASRGPDCKSSSKSNGGYTFCVNNDGKQQCVNCPPIDSNGSCSVASAGAAGGAKKVNVDQVFKGKAPMKKQ